MEHLRYFVCCSFSPILYTSAMRQQAKGTHLLVFMITRAKYCSVSMLFNFSDSSVNIANILLCSPGVTSDMCYLVKSADWVCKLSGTEQISRLAPSSFNGHHLYCYALCHMGREMALRYSM